MNSTIPATAPATIRPGNPTPSLLHEPDGEVTEWGCGCRRESRGDGLPVRGGEERADFGWETEVVKSNDKERCDILGFGFWQRR